MYNIILISVMPLLMVMLLPTEVDTQLDLVTINGKYGMCPSQDERENAIQNITNSVQAILEDSNLLSLCGVGPWREIAYLNMSDPLQQCPSAWREYNESGVRTCRSPLSFSSNCSGTFYMIKQRYSKVCGRAIGYQVGETEAFYHYDEGIDSYYVHGVSVTHGQPRNHIWTFASGLSEVGDDLYNCPCSNPSSSSYNRYPPSFVRDNYYCESGIPTDTYMRGHLYDSDRLWDGQQCEGECCSNGKSPPWFSVELPNPTTDDIEVRICIPHSNVKDVALELLEIYVQ